MENANWVSGGFVVARWTERNQAIPGNVFPDRLVSASERVAPILPCVPVGWLSAANAPPGRFAGSADKYMGNVLWALVSDLQRFGLASDRACVLEECLSRAEEYGDFVAPSGFASLAIARNFLCLAGRPGRDAMILSLALAAEDVQATLAGCAGDGFTSALLLREEAAPADGVVLGYEVLGLEDGELMSWAEELARVLADEEHGLSALRVNENGLIRTLDGAREIAARGNARDHGTHWSAWRLMAFPVGAEVDADRRAKSGETTGEVVV